MIRGLYILFLFICFPKSGLSQIPFGSIYVDISNFKDDVDSIYQRKFDTSIRFKNLNIYPSYATISKRSINNKSVLIFHHSDDTLLIGLDTISLNVNYDKKIVNNTKKNIPVLHDGRVNFRAKGNKYHVTKLKKGKKEQYIYIYTGNNIEDHNEIIFNDGNLFENVIYEGLEFKPGTYLINLFDKKSCLNKKLKKGKDISEYIRLEINNRFTIKNKGVLISKISKASISPKEFEKYYKNKDLKRPKAIRKLLSVFEENNNVKEKNDE